MTRPEEALLVEEHEAPYADAFAELEDGRILRVTTKGDETTFRTSDDGGVTWSQPFQGRCKSGEAIQGSNLCPISGNSVCMITGSRGEENPNAYPYGPEKVKVRTLFWRSDDGGVTWDGPVDVAAPGVTIYGGKVISLASGRLLLSTYMGLGQ